MRNHKNDSDKPLKVYRSKKVPKQVYFPDQRKVVRRKRSTTQDGPELRQLTFLPEKMRSACGIVQDSEDEEDDQEIGFDEEEGMGRSIQESAPDSLKPGNNMSKATAQKKKKRPSDVMEESEASSQGERRSPQPKSKRVKRAPAPKRKTKARAKADGSLNELSEPLSSTASSNPEPESVRRERRKRQSTMTQLVDGRLPCSQDEEPQFRPVKRETRSRVRRGEAGSNAQQQRTLTQMIPGLTPIGVISDSEDDETEEDEGPEMNLDHVSKPSLSDRSFELGEQTHQSDDENPTRDETNGEEEDNSSDDYQPTQYIEAPAKRRTHSPRQSRRAIISSSPPQVQTPRRPARTRFSLLATPERRRVVEIPSSQSPAITPLSMHKTPTSGRHPLHERPANAPNPDVTPSRRKRVAFEAPVEDTPPLPLVRKNTILDSDEDSDEGLVELEPEVLNNEVGPDTQALIQRLERPIPGRNIGSETQAMLDEIDLACDHAEDDAKWNDRKDRLVLESPRKLAREMAPPQSTAPLSSSINRRIKEEPLTQSLGVSPIQLRPSKISPQRRSFKEEREPSPTLVKSEPNDDGAHEEPTLTPPQIQETSDLDNNSIQVPCSPLPRSHRESQGTAHSHSSRAEEQLRTEWKSYSQYQKARPPLSSSARAVHDSDPFSYQATPFRNSIQPRPPPPQSWDPSQATTADNSQPSPKATPKKRQSGLVGADVSPHRVPSSQIAVSPPDRPPVLLIPSSFPSPSKMGYGDWESPSGERKESTNLTNGELFTQIEGMDSVEDFSIPPLPPLEDDDMFE
ncbi:hypothetical protein BU24DRAFT_8228 [Aaosphaeria arxii CBS 175.79]|uniref:Uncharacterized protein n=1 Tax=Aaosphaeria arxii CBS 175.79 TaxID=1450172 RepID=A0A6A5Y7I6_9PLEO|nr:uncharacterized protein BU24DRAFT_8228 [Aaosphaeria arxii CBS 175.79]KAF2020770.1 hypothetical protein BU24DRAFT_8228 [Aaosphaeria arxii CBS 175.79]